MKILIYSLSIFFGTFLGGLIPSRVSFVSESHLKLGVALGAGLLLGMSLVHMIPEAAELMPGSFGIWLLAGFLLLLFVERFAMVHACEEQHCDYHRLGWAAFLGLTVHGLIEGAALATSLVLPNIGPMVLVAILSHKLPSGVVLATILRLAGTSKSRSLAFVGGVSLSGPIGLMMSYSLLSHSAFAETAGALLAASAGTFLYIGACDLLPELHKKGDGRWGRLIGFFLGIGVAVLGELFHDH